MSESKRRAFAERLVRKEMISAPGVFDGVSQEFPKTCGHMLGRRVVPLEDIVAKIRVACDSRNHRHFTIVARTDARTTLALDEARRRGRAHVKAGADVLFIESPESVAEIEKIGRAFEVPLVANMVEAGRTPIREVGQGGGARRAEPEALRGAARRADLHRERHPQHRGHVEGRRNIKVE